MVVAVLVVVIVVVVVVAAMVVAVVVDAAVVSVVAAKLRLNKMGPLVSTNSETIALETYIERRRS